MPNDLPRVRVIRTDLLREVRKADPDWDVENRRGIVYKFSNNRTFERKFDTDSEYGGNSPASSDRLTADSLDITADSTEITADSA